MMALGRITWFSRTILIIAALLLMAQIASFLFVDRDPAAEHIAFQIFENCLMMIAVFIPVILEEIAGLRIPRALDIAFVAFCFSALVLGDIFDFYGKFRWWDMVLHGISGIMLGLLGYVIISAFMGLDKCRIRVSPFFVSIWTVSFALAVGAVWEICEYTVDGIFGLNSQQYLTSTGTFDASKPLQGHAALRDTMEDIILNLLGAAIVAIFIFCDFPLTSRGIKAKQRL